MTDYAISVEELGKRYRIGKAFDPTAGGRSILHRLTSPFHYLASTLREPSPDETLWALQDVSFQVEPGEVVGIVGHNGAGKSTLLKILSRITEPTHGQAVVKGRVGSLLEVGTGFHPELTGRENIFLSGTILGMRKAEIAQKFDEIVAFAGIARFLDTQVKRYSSGMYVRLAFAVAAHLEPEILLVDEVLAVGDAAFQKQCLGKMGDVAGRGRTVLFVSHNMAAIAQLCNWTVWLDQGNVMQIGSSSEVVKNYLMATSPQRPEQSWEDLSEAPGDDRVRLYSCKVVQNESTAAVIDINQPFHIQFEFSVLKHVKNLITGITLYNEYDVCLLSCFDWRPNDLNPATYQKQINFPPQLLAEGTLRIMVQLRFYDPDIRSVVLPDALKVETMDSEHPLAVRGHYKRKWPGVMRVHLPWTDAEPVQSLWQSQGFEQISG